MKRATTCRLHVTVLALAAATLLVAGYQSQGGETSAPAVHYAAINRQTACDFGNRPWKNDLWNGFLLSLPATQVSKCNAGCRGEEAVSRPQEAITHFIVKNNRCPLFLASPLHTPSVGHRAFTQKVKRKITSTHHRVVAFPVLPASRLEGCPSGSPAGYGMVPNSARWCRPPP
jgi:hypothetical protein